MVQTVTDRATSPRANKLLPSILPRRLALLGGTTTLTDCLVALRYLADVLAVIDAPEVALEFVSPSKPAVLKPVGHPEYLYVAMPMHINR